MTTRRRRGHRREANALWAVACERGQQSDPEAGLGEAAVKSRVIGAMGDARLEAGGPTGPFEDRSELRARHAGNPRNVPQRRQVDRLARPVAVWQDEEKRLG
jgi:hypothetical protein